MKAAEARFFLITIDTEGDNLWSRTEFPGTRNAAFLPRFQTLCETFGFKPVYLVDYQMARDLTFTEFGRAVVARGAGEIGMHLHAWSTPGGAPAQPEDHRLHPYLVNLEERVMRDKIRRMTDLLAETFGCAPVSHRAGRWVIDERYVSLLAETGYMVDCSVTPSVRWPLLPSRDGRKRGADYRSFPECAYFMDPTNIARAGGSGVLQVPMTTAPARERWDDALRIGAARFTGWTGRLGPRTAWLRPTGRNLASMLRLLARAEEKGHDYVEFMLHSSEFMPGGSPTFPDGPAIEMLFSDLEQLFAAARQKGYAGCTLKDYRAHWLNRVHFSRH